MSDEDIRSGLKRFYIDVPPVVASTRRILASKLDKLKMACPERQPDTESSFSASGDCEIHDQLHLNEVEVVHQADVREEIKTLVFFDLETTGIKKSTFKPKITELSFVAVSAEDFLQFERKLTNKLRSGKAQDIEFSRPRVMNKLTVCVNPCSLIMPQITDVTGLDNYNLEEQQEFQISTTDLLGGFLARLPPPVCFVARGGNHFDYPLLNAEFGALGYKGLDQTLCVDSLTALRDIFKRNNSRGAKETDEQSELASKKPKLEPDNVQPNLVPRMVKLDPEPCREPITENAMAPDSKLSVVCPPTLVTKFDKMRQENGNGLKEEGVLAKKRLDFSGSDQQFLSQPKSFSLPLLHEHIFGVKPRVSHGAEEDCLALMRVCASRAQDFIQYSKTNCCPLQSLPKMW